MEDQEAFIPKPQFSGPAGPTSPCVAGLRPGPSFSLSCVLAAIGMKTFSLSFSLARLTCPAPSRCVAESVCFLPFPHHRLTWGGEYRDAARPPSQGTPWLDVCSPGHLGGLQNGVSITPCEGKREPLRAYAVLGLWCTLCRAGDGGFSLVLSAVVSWCSSSPGGRAFSRPLPRTPDSSCLLTAPAGKAHQNCLTVSWEVKPGGNSDILSWPGARKSVSVIRVRISARSRCALPRGRSFSTLLLLLDFTCECLCI